MSSAKLTPVEGMELKVPCLVSPGAFSSERFVKIDAQADKDKELTITAFVPDSYVDDPQPNSTKVREGRVVTIVRYSEPKHVGLMFPGELLSVSNPVRVSRVWLSQKIEREK